MRRRAGFTLIEVLLTLLIMAGIMVTITQILTAARKNRDEIHNIQERQLAGPAILQRLERDLRALVVFNRDPRTVLRVRDSVISGFDADTIDFVCTVDSLMPYREGSHEAFRRADVNEVGYRLRPHPQSDDFLEIYRREAFGSDSFEGEPFDEGLYIFLYDRVRSFDIQVYLEDGVEAEPLDEWGADSSDPESIGLPARLEITLVIEVPKRIGKGEMLPFAQAAKIEQTYRRIIRLPQSVRFADAREIPRPRVPERPAASGGGGGGGGGPGEGEGEGDGDDRDGTGGDGGDGGGGGGGDAPQVPAQTGDGPRPGAGPGGGGG